MRRIVRVVIGRRERDRSMRMGGSKVRHGVSRVRIPPLLTGRVCAAHDMVT